MKVSLPLTYHTEAITYSYLGRRKLNGEPYFKDEWKELFKNENFIRCTFTRDIDLQTDYSRERGQSLKPTTNTGERSIFRDCLY